MNQQTAITITITTKHPCLRITHFKAPKLFANDSQLVAKIEDMRK